jgi:hypothetical protein
VPLPNPIIDDRSYQQLRDELVRRIPVYTPEWTDFNASDPGVTLIELFAFLGENVLFRFNQIPETTKLAYLKLLQIPLRPATPALGLVNMSTQDPSGPLTPIATEVRAGNLSFETLTEVEVWPVSFYCVGKLSAPAPDPTTEPEVYEFAVRALQATAPLATNEDVAYYQNQAVPLNGQGLPADFSAAVDGMLWVAVLAGKNADPTQLGDALLNLGFVPDPTAPGIKQVGSCPGVGPASITPAVEWQISTGQFDSPGNPIYQAITAEGDTTHGLTQEGVVRLRLPKDPASLGNFAISDPNQAGTRDLPPVLDDTRAAQLLFWIRAFRKDGTRFGSVIYVVANAAQVWQSRKASPEFLGTGTGQPDQSYSLVNSPVLDGTLIVQVEEASGWVQWKVVDGFYASNPDSRDCVVDLEAGVVRFGNGVQGLPPQIGQRIRALEYRYGGGASGNVPPGFVTKLPSIATIKVNNDLSTHGGADAEAIPDALDRIPGELRRRDRAVTASDFEELARATPGAAVGRADCLPLFYPPTLESGKAGVVSVVVWPQSDVKNPNAPLPDRNVLQAVCTYLDQRRLVTTELYVIPPTYRKVAVAVGLQVQPGFGIEAVRRWVELVIRQYLAPLPPFGPDGNGWPLGRRVFGPELQAAALQVEGVDYLEGLDVAAWDDNQQNWVTGTVNLNAWEVPELAEITVVAGPQLKPGEAIGPVAPPKLPVPIPIIREVC